MRRSWWSERLYREEWNIGVLRQTAEKIVRHRFTCCPTWLRIEEGVMRADPNCLRLEGGYLLLLAEHMDYQIGRGEIWSSVLPPDGKIEDAIFCPFLSAAVHLSYPFLFTDDAGRICLTAESWAANDLFLWSRNREGWGFSSLILPNRPAIDATLWRDTNRWWLFCGFVNDLPNERLHLFYADRPEGPWLSHPANPIKADIASSPTGWPAFQVRRHAYQARPGLFANLWRRGSAERDHAARSRRV